MGDTFFPLSAEDGHDDLPRTFRREREARQREAAEREAVERLAKATSPNPSIEPAFGPHPEISLNAPYAGTDFPPATVKRFEVPFLSLMLFFIKAVLAAIPALILLGALIWLGGEILQSYFPWLVKMQIFIHFPQ